ncbi:unnamed protein product [Darwinula stevensoni]|uniref:CUB domain-containing protein n=1 Tax=Darwinula stevensoni TaxID=69355 RepID=A0A7R9FNF2_9CRUS|nr:unnamed protein product [Darwinula stevensoni]CAG0896397.1 unnamed protein product [Darwinula stevensoni]
MHRLALVSLLLVAAGVAQGSPPSKRFFFAPQCGSASQALTANSSTTIQSPNYPSNYPNNYCYEWNFSCPNQMTLSCPDIQILSLFFCLDDVLEVSGNGERKYLCGNTALNYVVPANGMLFARFRTDWLLTAKGFQCTVSCAA